MKAGASDVVRFAGRVASPERKRRITRDDIDGYSGKRTAPGPKGPPTPELLEWAKRRRREQGAGS